MRSCDQGKQWLLWGQELQHFQVIRKWFWTSINFVFYTAMCSHLLENMHNIKETWFSATLCKYLTDTVLILYMIHKSPHTHTSTHTRTQGLTETRSELLSSKRWSSSIDWDRASEWWGYARKSLASIGELGWGSGGSQRQSTHTDTRLQMHTHLFPDSIMYKMVSIFIFHGIDSTACTSSSLWPLRLTSYQCVCLELSTVSHTLKSLAEKRHITDKGTARVASGNTLALWQMKTVNHRTCWSLCASCATAQY